MAEILEVSLRTYVSYENDLAKQKGNMYELLIEKARKHFLVDEENGVISIEDIKEGVAEVVSRYDVLYCYLFGSYAKNKARPSSDIDLYIETGVTGIRYYGMVEELRERLNKKIDLINTEQLMNNKNLLVEILKDGIKIYG